MAWADWQGQAVLGGFKAVGSYFLQSRQAKADKAWQRYNNALTRMQNAQNQDAITINETLLQERTIRAKYAIEQSAYRTSGEAEMAAAAVGAEGNSVSRALAQIQKNATREQNQIDRDFEAQALQLAEQRTASNFQTEMQIDYRQIPKPNIASSLLSFGADTGMKWWESKIK